MNHAQRDNDDNEDKGPEALIEQGDQAYAEQFHRHGMIRQPFLDRIAGLSRDLINGRNFARSNQVGKQATPQQGQQGSGNGTHAAKPGTVLAAQRTFGKASRLWLANHASGRDVAQTPSNLG